MSAATPRPSTARRTPLVPLVILALLPATAAAQPGFSPAQPAVPERVVKVRQALLQFGPDPDTRKEAQEELDRRVKALRGVNDLAQALVLPEWEGAHTVGVTPPAGREALARRFEEALGKALAGDAAQQCAAATLFAEMTIDNQQPGRGHGLDGFLTKTLSPLVDKVEPLTRSKDAAVREAVAHALGRTALEPKKVVEALARLLGDKEKEVAVRRATAMALVRQARGGDPRPGELGPEARNFETDLAACSAVVPVAVKGLGDEDDQVSRDCALAVKQAAWTFKGPLGTLEFGPRVRFREPFRLAADALGQGVEPLRSLLKSAKAERRVQACQALEAIASIRGQVLQVASDGSALAEALGDKKHPLHIGLREAVPDLAECAGHKNVEVRLAALYVLEDLGPDAAPAADKVVSALKDDDPFVRWAAARVLGKMAPAEPKMAVPALAARIGDDNGDVRITALAALERYGPAALPAVKEVSGAAIKGGDEQTRLWAVRVLAAVGPDGRKQTTASLIEALTAKETAIRRAAAAALARFGKPDETATKALRNALADDDPQVRRTASEALLAE
jgi:HEAT repeat protein